jgi:hypothetical protein
VNLPVRHFQERGDLFLRDIDGAHRRNRSLFDAVCDNGMPDLCAVILN